VPKLSSWPNRVTIARIGLVFYLVVLVYDQNLWTRLLAAFLAVLVIVGDWADFSLIMRTGYALLKAFTFG
jgi:phosphatidylglycerophosphate synthase